MNASTPRTSKRPAAKGGKGQSGTSGSDGGEGNTPEGARPASRREQLRRDVEHDIVPRLILAHRASPRGTSHPPSASGGLSRQEIVQFAMLAARNDLGVALAFVESMRERGMSLDSVFLDLLAPAARHLGELWAADLCDFTEVTVGLWRLQQVARELSPAFRRDAEPRAEERRILLAASPGEQHTFGLVLVAEFFRRAGWDVWTESSPTAGGLVDIARSEWFGVLGLSVSCASRLEGLSTLIHAVRRGSRNRGIGVMVGGPLFVEHPELVSLVGADATAVDAQQACLQAEALVALLVQRGDESARRETREVPTARINRGRSCPS